jgi:streptogramin lyase
MKALRLFVFLAAAAILWSGAATGQHPAVPKLTQAQVEQLISNGVPDSTLSAQIQKRGLAFAPTLSTVESLRAKGAGPLTLEAIEAFSPKGTRSAATNTAKSANRVQSSLFSGAQLTLGDGFSNPFGVAVNSKGNVFVADENAVKEIAPGCASVSCVKTLTGGSPFGVAVDETSDVFVADISGVNEILAAGNYTKVKKLGGDFQLPHGVAVDRSGNVFVAEYGDGAVGGWAGAVKEILAAGGYNTVSILGGGFNHPMGVAVDGNGNVFVADAHNSAVKEIPSNCGSATCVKTLGGGFSEPVGVAVDESGNVFVVDAEDTTVREILAVGGYTTVITLGGGFNTPMGVAVDRIGNVFVADRRNNRVVELRVAGPNAAPDAVAQSTNSEPSLAATMQFIQDKLGEQGQIDVVIAITTQPGGTRRDTLQQRLSDVVADSATCTLRSTETVDQATISLAGDNATPTAEQRRHIVQTRSFSFNNIETVAVDNVLETYNRGFANSNAPKKTVTVEPPIFLINVRASKEVIAFHVQMTRDNQSPQINDFSAKGVGFTFRDEEMANRVAKAMRHAVDLCGGGNKEPF